MGAILTVMTFTIGISYFSLMTVDMISGFHDVIDNTKMPNYFDGEFDYFKFSQNDQFEPEYVIKAFGYKFFEENFNVSIGEEKLTDSRFLKVDIKKIE